MLNHFSNFLIITLVPIGDSLDHSFHDHGQHHVQAQTYHSHKKSKLRRMTRGAIFVNTQFLSYSHGNQSDGLIQRQPCAIGNDHYSLKVSNHRCCID